jgi:hypothetical protein
LVVTMNRRKLAILVCGGLLAMIILFAGMWLLLNAMQGEPFQMVVEPDEKGAAIQFFQGERNLASPRFHVEQKVDAIHTVVLDSPDVQIPIGAIVFADHTFLPGRFTIVINDRRFDVMQSRIEVDNQNFAWQAQ